MADQTAGGGDNHIGAQAEAFRLLVVAVAVVAAVYRHTAHTVKIVADAFHGLVYLLGQLAGGAHNHTVDGVLWVVAVFYHAQNGQQVGGGLAGACLGHAYQVVTVQDGGYARLLDGRAGLEAHVVERIEKIVIQV